MIQMADQKPLAIHIGLQRTPRTDGPRRITMGWTVLFRFKNQMEVCHTFIMEIRLLLEEAQPRNYVLLQSLDLVILYSPWMKRVKNRKVGRMALAESLKLTSQMQMGT